MIRFKPGASITTHLFFAALLWTVIGCFLLLRGVTYLLPVQAVIVFIAAIFIGTAKSLLLLDKTARKNIARILQFGDNTCLGGVYSLKTWGLVLIMIIGGRLLRSSTLPAEVIGGIYVAVGWALFFSSRIAWARWKKL